MRHIYLPAVAPGVLKPYRMSTGAIHWLEDPHHPHYLASYAVWSGKDIDYRRDADAHILGDSGGFSIVSKNARVDPAHSLLWQIRNTTVGVILDIPPFVSGGKSRFAGSAADVLKESITRTIGNVRHALPYYLRALDEGTKFRWWGVVQGESLSQMRMWLEAVRDVYPFEEEGEGWALAPKPCNDLFQVTRFLRIAREYGFKRVHMLQTSKVRTIGVMLALAKMSEIEFITNDSATCHINAGNRNAFLAYDDYWDGVWVPAAHHSGWEGVQKFLLEENNCRCFSCERMREEIQQWPSHSGRYYKDRLAFHNFLSLQAVMSNLHAQVEVDADRVLRMCAGEEYGMVLREWEGHEQVPTPRRTVSILDRIR